MTASGTDTIGLSLLRTMTTNLDGTGVRVAQVEGGAPAWEFNPDQSGLPTNVFSNHFAWFSNGKKTNLFPNSLGSESSHGDLVADIFFSEIYGGVSTNVAHVDNFEASFFSQFMLPSLSPITDSVVNLSFTIDGINRAQQLGFDSSYDTYAAQFNTLFLSASGDGGTVATPATCYNGIGVGAYGGSTGLGPTPDNGRAKPDITAPGGASSWSTPLVSGSAALLLQAGRRGDGGSDTNSATDLRTLKALLLNGAIKPADWSNAPPSPLDPRYGSGVLNVFNSWSQLAGGKHAFIASNAVALGAAHPPESSTGNVSALSGWDFNGITSGSNNDAINHYYFSLAGTVGGPPFTATATLVWNRQAHQTNLNQLDLFLFRADTGVMIAGSASAVDNVQHLFSPALPAGRYDLQVLKHGGSVVTSNETYALAFEFFSEPLNFFASNGAVTFAWPAYPDGFRLESSPSLNSAASWNSAGLPTASLTNGQNVVTVKPPLALQYYRLVRP